MNKLINISIMALMLLSMVSATYVTEAETQGVVSGQSEPGYYGDDSDEERPSIAPYPNPEYSGTLREGETKIYRWNGEEYQVTLVWVSDAQYWEDDNRESGKVADAQYAPSLDNKPSAKFSINGELTDALHPGEKDEVKYGTIKVKSIGNAVSANAENDVGSATYTFYPRNYNPPTNTDKIKIYEGQSQTVTVQGRRFNVGVEEIHDEIAVMAVNGQAAKVREGSKTTVNGLGFYAKDVRDNDDNRYLEAESDIAYQRGYVILTDLHMVSVEPQYIKGRLAEGQSQTYRWNGQSYELTLIYVSDPVYWEDSTGKVADTAASISNRPTAKFMLNGYVTDTIPVGGSDKTRCGKIQVTKIETTTGAGDEYWGLEKTEVGYADTDEAMANAPEYVGPPEIDRRRGIAYFTLMPTSCNSIQPQACTEEAKMCPGGSSVSRNPNNNCAFDPCPNTNDDEEKQKCYASGGQWECLAYATTDPNNPYGNADAVYQGDDNCRCYYPPTPQPYDDDADRCQEMGGQWSCSGTGSEDGTIGGCDCYLSNMPYPTEPCYEGCAPGEDCGCDYPIEWDDQVEEGQSCQSGCLKDSRCLPYGTRLANGDAVFCSIEGEFTAQQADGASCQNNYECVSNQCLNAECKSLDKDIKETQNLISKLFDWFGNIFN